MDLTDETLNKIRMLMETVVEQKIEPLREQISHLPTKEEFFSSQDKVIKELKTVREEQTALTYRSKIHDTQIRTIATHLNLSL